MAWCIYGREKGGGLDVDNNDKDDKDDNHKDEKDDNDADKDDGWGGVLCQAAAGGGKSKMPSWQGGLGWFLQQHVFT